MRMLGLADRADRRRAVLIVVDAQNDFVHPQGSMALGGRDVGQLAGALGAVRELIPVARAAGVPVVHVRSHHGPATDSPAWLARHAGDPGPASCAPGSWGAEIAVPVLPRDWMVTKHRYGAFSDTDLEERLRAAGRDLLLFTGFVTNVCVETSVREAVCRDFYVSVVEDCCGAYSRQAHDSSLATLGRSFGLVASSADVAEVWAGSALSRAPGS